MRIIAIIVAMICFSSSPAFSTSDLNFDEFIRSREVVATLYFQPNNEDLSSSERERLSDTIGKLRELQEDGRMIRVEGFSSPVGDRESNFQLSLFRAHSVAVLIESKGLPAEVTLTGYGDLRATSDDHSKQRRVEIASYLRPVGMQRVRVAGENEGMKRDFPQKPLKIDAYVIEQAIRIKIDDKDIDSKDTGIADKDKVKGKESDPDLSQKKEKKSPGVSRTRSKKSSPGVSRTRSKKSSPGVSRTRSKKSSPGVSRTRSKESSPGVSRTRSKESSPGVSRTRSKESSPGLSRTRSKESSPGLSKAKKRIEEIDPNRGYEKWRESIDPGLSSKSDQAKEAADRDLKRGYSQATEAANSDRRFYRQAIDAAENDIKRDYSQATEADDKDIKRGYSQATEADDKDIKRGYSQATEADDKDIKRGYSQATEADDKDIKRGYSQATEAEPVLSPGVTQTMPAIPFTEALRIEQTLMIEEAIVEKIDADHPEPVGKVSQVNIDY